MNKLEKRISALEVKTNDGEKKIKSFIVGREDFKEKLAEAAQAKAEGYFVILRILVAPGEHEEDSEWGEYLRNQKTVPFYVSKPPR